MGKTRMRRIENAPSWQLTFPKRCNGLLKKYFKLSVLCDVEEEKKPEEAEMEEPNKAEEGKKAPKEEAKRPEKPADDNKPVDSKDAGDGKESKEQTSSTPPDIVLKVYMDCEGCARKVRHSLKGFPGVEDVITDCKTHKVVVKGVKADPLKVLERVKRKSNRQVELLSSIPKPPAEEERKPEEKEKPKPEEKKAKEGEEKKEGESQGKEGTGTEESKVVDLKMSDYCYYPQRYAMETYAYPLQIFSGENPDAMETYAYPPQIFSDENPDAMEMYAYAPQIFSDENPDAMEMYAYAPQVFSDENPNACSVM